MYSRPFVTVRGIIYHEGQLFLQKLKQDSGTNDFWSTPGGKLDRGEDLISGLKREMIEETGVIPQVGRLLFVQQFVDKKDREWLEFFYHIENAPDYMSIDLASTSHGEDEVAEFGFVDPSKVALLPEGLAQIDIASYIDSQQPVYLMNYL